MASDTVPRVVVALRFENCRTFLIAGCVRRTSTSRTTCGGEAKAEPIKTKTSANIASNEKTDFMIDNRKN